MSAPPEVPNQKTLAPYFNLQHFKAFHYKKNHIYLQQKSVC